MFIVSFVQMVLHLVHLFVHVLSRFPLNALLIRLSIVNLNNLQDNLGTNKCILCLNQDCLNNTIKRFWYKQAFGQICFYKPASLIEVLSGKDSLINPKEPIKQFLLATTYGQQTKSNHRRRFNFTSFAVIGVSLQAINGLSQLWSE